MEPQTWQRSSSWPPLPGIPLTARFPSCKEAPHFGKAAGPMGNPEGGVPCLIDRHSGSPGLSEPVNYGPHTPQRRGTAPWQLQEGCTHWVWAESGKSGQAHDSRQVSWPPGLSVLACPGAVAYPGGTSTFCPTCQPPALLRAAAAGESVQVLGVNCLSSMGKGKGNRSQTE